MLVGYYRVTFRSITDSRGSRVVPCVELLIVLSSLINHTMVQTLHFFITKLWSHVRQGGYRKYAIHQIVADHPLDNPYDLGSHAVAAL